MSTVKFKNINKIYPNKFQAVYDFNLEVNDKEFVALVGPSGCGKSTTLRMLAGLESITSGEIEIDDEVVNDVLPKDRDIAMVFQSYALYPHMSVYDNMAFGLKMRHMPKKEIDKRVKEAAEILGLTDYLKKKPKVLSGGQKQRVALGRAIVRTPKVFLMDEPLSNLDAKLRVAMRSEITRIHKTVNATTIYVTHDQTEAMTMADRIVIMKDGYIQQIGAPKTIYNDPNNVFVAGFIGSPAMNFFKGNIENGKFVFKDSKTSETFFSITLTSEQLKILKDYEGKEVLMGARPEHIYLTNNPLNSSPSDPFTFKTEIVELLGNELIIYTRFNDTQVITKALSSNDINVGDEISCSFDLKQLLFFDCETSLRIR